MFQFLIGRLITNANYSYPEQVAEFQFLIGRLITIDEIEISRAERTGFNSS